MPSGSVPLPMPARSGRQAVVRPARHGPHSPQAGAQERITRSPTARPVDVVADRLDDARALVAEHHRPRAHPLALDDVQVGAADADRVDAHQRIAGPGPVEIDVAHDERDARRLEQRRAHPHRHEAGSRQSAAAISAAGAISHSHVSA